MRARSWFTIGRTKIIILSVWLLSIALSLPAVAVQGSELAQWYKGPMKVSILMCVDHVDDKWRKVYAWYQMCILFALPAIIMAFCYSIVVYVLWISTRQLAKMTSQSKKYDRNVSSSDDESRHRLASNTYSNASSGDSQRGNSTLSSSRGAREHSAAVQTARKQVIRMLITVVVIFLVCWGPKLIFALLIRYKLRFLFEKSGPVVKSFLYLLPYVQSCVNPIVYGFMSSNFRRGLRHVCRVYFCHHRVYEKCFGRGRSADYELETKTNGTTSQTLLMSRYSHGDRKISSKRVKDVAESEYESIKVDK